MVESSGVKFPAWVDGMGGDELCLAAGNVYIIPFVVHLLP